MIETKVKKVNAVEKSLAPSPASSSTEHLSESSNSSSNSEPRVRVRADEDGCVKAKQLERRTSFESCNIVTKTRDVLNDRGDFSWRASPFSHRLIALGIVFVPTLSLAGACEIRLLFVTSFLHAIGVKVTNEKISKLAPSTSATSLRIKKTLAETLAMIRRSASGKNFTLLATQ